MLTMKSIRFMAATALASATIFGATGPAWAQDAAPADEASADEGQAIVVTGSRIRRPNLDSAVPITSIAGEQAIQTGDTNLGEALNELPQLRSTFSQQNPGLGVGIAGLNLLDLRGLGTVRTLVVVNGRRHVAADILNNAVSPDVNTIPNDLIERVDIVTGAQSSVYGSDAIAGVVNFVLRRNFEGLQFRGNASISEKGYGGEQYLSAMYGTNFAGDRGNIIVHGEYAHQDRLFGSQIPQYASVDGLATVDVDPAGSDGIPDRVFFRDIRSSTIATTGIVPITQITGGAAPCGVSTSAAPAVPFNCNFIFTTDGRLIPQTGGRAGTTINGFFIGGNGETGREGQQLSILPKMDRYNFNMLGRYEFSEAAEAFVEAKWTRINVRGSNASPTFTQGGSFTEQGRPASQQRERLRLDNPFLNAADRTTLANALLASDCDNTISGSACSATATSTTRLDAAEEAQIAAGTYRFVFAKRFADIGIRDETFERDTYRIVGGLRGTFNEDWNYEISANYGKFVEDTVQTGYVDRQRFLLSLDAGRNPATGQIQCRAQFDAASAYAFQSAALNATQNAATAARLASDIAACVPYNPFGAGGETNAAASAYFSYAARNRAELEQFVLSGFLSGDTSQFFNLPGGPVRFALGGEYRREKALYINDPFTVAGGSNAVNIGIFDPPTSSVREAFGEIQLPILNDVPFFHELTATAAGRISDYKGAVGTVYTYNGGVEWAPIQDIRFRANYGRAIRAPNASETGFPIVPNFAPGFQDPCAGSFIGQGSATRAANCLTDLGPTLLANLATLGAPSLPVLSGSNPNLKEETSDSYTVGVVLQPRFVPGLSLSVDYFDITVKNVIVSLSAQTIANNCYDAPTLVNPFCGLFQRYRGPAGGGPFGEIPGQIQGNTLIQAGVNFARRVRRGLDVNMSYRTNINENVKLGTNLIYVHNFQTSNFQDPARPNFENRILGELGDPVNEFRWDTDLTVGQVTFGYQLRFIGRQYVNTYEDFNVLQGRPAENADFADRQKYPQVFYHNIRFEWNMPGAGGSRSAFRLYAGVDNLTNKFPPLGLTGTGTGGAGADRGTGNAAIYETQGRTFFAGFKANF
jgi:outer membrane receptor protein involved in Fe transport